MSLYTEIRDAATAINGTRREVIEYLRCETRAATVGEALFNVFARRREPLVIEALADLDLTGWPECACECDCEDPATNNDYSVPLCVACTSYLVTDDGDVICERQTLSWTRCPECSDDIIWGRIETEAPGVANARYGACGCGERWSQRDHGGTWYSSKN